MLFLLACTIEKNIDTSTGDALVDTASDMDTNIDSESSCFSSTAQDPYFIYATPYNTEGSPSNSWNFQPQNSPSVVFSMGRSSIGEISISADGSWGIVPQDDGSVGVFRVQDGQLTVLQENLMLSTAEREIYTAQVWLDSRTGTLWITDTNWPDNGGGLFTADIDCSSGSIGAAEEIFPSKNAFGVAPFSEEVLVFVSRESEELTQQVTLFETNTYDFLHTGQAFDDDEAIFSALATDGENILIGDNSAFSGIPNRVSHLRVTNDSLESVSLFELQDPISIQIHDGQALIASGLTDSLWQYDLLHSSFVELSLSGIELPSTIIQDENNFYIAENTAIRHLRLENGAFMDQGLLLDTSGIEGIIGAIGVFGEQ